MKKIILAVLTGFFAIGTVSAADYGYDYETEAELKARQEYSRKGGSGGITGGMKNTPKPWQIK